MKKTILPFALLALIGSSVSVQAADHPPQHQMKKGGMPPMNPEQMDQRMRSMQAHMLMMHDYANRILNENDPIKKQKLKDEQLELMKAHHMEMMQHHAKMMGQPAKMKP
jgi:hypothetical protein